MRPSQFLEGGGAGKACECPRGRARLQAKLSSLPKILRQGRWASIHLLTSDRVPGFPESGRPSPRRCLETDCLRRSRRSSNQLFIRERPMRLFVGHHRRLPHRRSILLLGRSPTRSTWAVLAAHPERRYRCDHRPVGVLTHRPA